MTPVDGRAARLRVLLVLYVAGNAVVGLARLGWEVLAPPTGATGIIPVLMLVAGSAGSAAGTAMIAVVRRSR